MSTSLNGWPWRVHRREKCRFAQTVIDVSLPCNQRRSPSPMKQQRNSEQGNSSLEWRCGQPGGVRRERKIEKLPHDKSNPSNCRLEGRKIEKEMELHVWRRLTLVARWYRRRRRSSRLARFSSIFEGKSGRRGNHRTHYGEVSFSTRAAFYWFLPWIPLRNVRSRSKFNDVPRIPPCFLIVL